MSGLLRNRSSSPGSALSLKVKDVDGEVLDLPKDELLDSRLGSSKSSSSVHRRNVGVEEERKRCRVNTACTIVKSVPLFVDLEEVRAVVMQNGDNDVIAVLEVVFERIVSVAVCVLTPLTSTERAKKTDCITPELGDCRAVQDTPFHQRESIHGFSKSTEK